MKTTKQEALAAHLSIDVDEAEKLIESGDYRVLTDGEADAQAAEYIKDSLWACNARFLADMTKIDAEVFEVLSQKCEGANNAVLSLVKNTCGLHALVDKAISVDGRGHFLSMYDGNENREGEFFIYRQN